MAVDVEIDPDYEEGVPSAKQRKIVQRESLDMMVEAQSIQKSMRKHQHLPPLLPDESTEHESKCGEEMNDDRGVEVAATKYPKSVLRKGSDMGVRDQTDRKPVNSEKKWSDPPTAELGSNSGDKYNGRAHSPELPFEHLTRGDLHTSTGKFWAFTGVSFPGSRIILPAHPHTHSTPTYHSRKYNPPDQRKIQLCNGEAQPEINVHPRT
jgi:hypothetical protein